MTGSGHQVGPVEQEGVGVDTEIVGWHEGPLVHRLIGRHSEEGVRKALRRLVEQGIVTSERIGSADLYRFNSDHLAAGPVVELASLFSRFLDRLRTAVAG